MQEQENHYFLAFILSTWELYPQLTNISFILIPAAFSLYFAMTKFWPLLNQEDKQQLNKLKFRDR